MNLKLITEIISIIDHMTFVTNELTPKNDKLVRLFYKKCDVCRRSSDQRLSVIFLTCPQKHCRRSQISRSECSVPCDPLGSPPLVLLLIHRPHRTFHVLHTHEALVQAQVVAHRVLVAEKVRGQISHILLLKNAYRVNHPDDWHLPSGSVASEISERPREPSVDLIEGKLPVRCFHNGLNGGLKLLL